MSYITTRDNTKLYVKDWGRGRPIILIHGWPLSADSWDDQGVVLADAGFRVIAYDRRGFGRSDQPWGGYDYDTLADDLSDVIKETDALDSTLVGFSMGGGEVARYMSRHNGKHVVQAALISSIVPYLLKTKDNPDGVDQAVFNQMTGSMKDDRSEFFTGFFKDFYGVNILTHPVSEEYLQWSRSVALQASLKATLECAKSFSTTDFRSDLAAFHVPTLIIHGTEDKTVPINASGRAAAKGISYSTLLEYPDAPHGLFATHKEQLANDLLNFVQKY